MCARPLITSRCLDVYGPNDGIRPEGKVLVQGSGLKHEGAGRVARPQGDRALLTNSELVDDRAVPLHVSLLEVVKKPAAATDELQQAAARVMVLRVGLEMLGEVGNAVREECDLHFWRPGIGVMNPIRVDEVRLLLLGGGQNPVLLMVKHYD